MTDTSRSFVSDSDMAADAETIARAQAHYTEAEPVGTAHLVPYEPPPVALPAVIPPQDELKALAQLATTLAGANALPVALRDKPNDVFLVLLSARDLGTSLTVALREFHVIEGKVTLSPKVKLAMVNERGREQGWAAWPDPDNDEHSATWYATRADRGGLQFHSTFGWEDGQRGGMVAWDCEPNEHDPKCKAAQRARERHNWCKNNWYSYPKRMLSWRALGYLLDDVFPEVGTGLFAPDELGAITDEDGNPVIDVTEVEPFAGHKGPRGRRQQQAAAGPEPITEEQRVELSARIEAIRPVEQAKAVLNELWIGPDPKAPNLGRPERLTERGHYIKGAAILASVEKRLLAGEWGEWAGAQDGTTSPDPAQTGAVAADGTTEGAESLSGHTEAVSQEVGIAHREFTDTVDSTGKPWSSDLELAQACNDEVAAMDSIDVLAALVARDVQAEGKPKDHKAQLATILYRERGGVGGTHGLNPEQQARIAEHQGTLVGVAPGALEEAHELVRAYSDADVLAEATDRALDTSVSLPVLRVVLAESIATDVGGDAQEVLPE